MFLQPRFSIFMAAALMLFSLYLQRPGFFAPERRMSGGAILLLDNPALMYKKFDVF
jgi:hypothetical protein